MATEIPKNLPMLSDTSDRCLLGTDCNRPLSPDACNRSIKSFSSTSTLDSIVIESSNSPPLPALLHVNVIELFKRPADIAAPGWGVKLRGTTSELAEGLKMYSCHVESVQEHGAAKEAGLKEGDQYLSRKYLTDFPSIELQHIVCIDDQPVQKFIHEKVVKIFQANDRVVLIVLPSRFRMCSQARILKRSSLSLNYIWALMQHLQVLEIINVNLGKDSSLAVDLSSLILLLKLSVHHCSLKHITKLKGLDKLLALESLSLAYNLLSSDDVCLFDFDKLKQLKTLDLGRNLLDSIPENICKITSLQSLVLVDNNIVEIPQSLTTLDQLETLCLDGNLLHEVDPVLKTMENIRNLTISNNQLECESEVVKLNDLLITCIQGNPFTTYDTDGILSRNEPCLRRTLSVRGQVLLPRNRHSLEWDGPLSELKYDESKYAIGSQ